jgi:hypothetical protein
MECAGLPGLPALLNAAQGPVLDSAGKPAHSIRVARDGLLVLWALTRVAREEIELSVQCLNTSRLLSYFPIEFRLVKLSIASCRF